jgi:ferric-dicitrate binding protein FerR (iron transport regulator)
MRVTVTRKQFLHLALSAAGLGASGALAGLISPARAAARPVGQVVKLRGTAALQRGEERIVLAKGDDVMAGDVVTTLAESRLRIALQDGSQLNLGELTKMTVAAFDFVAETKQRDAAFDLKSGVLQAITAKAGPGSSFVIRTQNAVAATRSTDWIVSAGQAETSVYVLEGKVDVGQSSGAFRSLSSAEQDKAMLLGAGQSVTIGKLALGGTLAPKAADAKKLAALKAGLALD